MKYQSMTKQELAALFPCSVNTLGRYIQLIEKRLPHYSRKQRLLTPDQVKIICEYYCVFPDDS